ncbi:helix-turn-helix domain-containing protein [Bifidobacterium margollesii]|uniref:helix-turn-helix domain-containing protein n=1 Tax=Bifidobacterium margollesii TaxID=2020964 RepID=UPI000C775B36
MTATSIAPKTDLDAGYIEKTISFNVKLRLAAKNMNQTDLANYLGVTRSTISVRLSGKSAWSVPDLVNTSNFLETTPADLMDDSLMIQMHRNEKTAAGNSRPRFLVGAGPEFSCPGCDSNARHPL